MGLKNHFIYARTKIEQPSNLMVTNWVRKHILVFKFYEFYLGVFDID